MERRSWRWKRRSSSSNKSDSSGSMSSHSDEQDTMRASLTSTSPNNVQSPEISSDIANSESCATGNNLSEKLSAALSNIKAKEELVKQHVKVAEEAVLGWEKAETEVAALKQQLEAGAQKNSVLKDKILLLDGALKECVRQLRQSGEDQELKIKEALVEKTQEWEAEKSELESRLTELQAQLDAKDVVDISSISGKFQSKIDALVKENSVLKVELHNRSEDLKRQTIERELSASAAETASKQHLESIKKVAKLEAECRKLKAAVRKATAVCDHKPLANSVYVESLTDSQSDSGERLSAMDNDPSCSDSWASALIAELDQFRNEKAVIRKPTSTVETELMDDFLEMERLAALQDADRASSSFEPDADSDYPLTRENLSKSELEAMHRQIAELEEKFEKITGDKRKIEMDLAETQNKLKLTCNELWETEEKCVELQTGLDSANASKTIFEKEVEVVESKRKGLESQLESANFEIGNLQEKVDLLEGKLEEKSVLCSEFKVKCWSLRAAEERRMQLETQLSSVNSLIIELHEKVDSLERKVKEERTLSKEFAAKCREMEDTVTTSKDMEAQLRFEIVELNVKANLLEGKVKDERALSTEFASKLEEVEAERKELNYQLKLAYLESGKLHEKIALLESEVARAGSAQYENISQNLEAVEADRKSLESQLSLARLEVEELQEKVSLLEANINEEKSFSAEVVSKLTSIEARKRALESELESACLEVARLHEKADMFGREVAEREQSAEYAARCESLEDKLSRKKQESELQSTLSSSITEAKTKQENELVVPGGNLEDCRKTIASLGRQLKSLATFEDFMFEAEELEGVN